VTVLPRVSGRDVVKALLKVGYERDRQRGSHIILRQLTYPHRRIVIPDHTRDKTEDESTKSHEGARRGLGPCTFVYFEDRLMHFGKSFGTRRSFAR
jgi:predicted RNA binding protein YcfA (HicA-like mRNA interferase family)